MNLSVDGYVDHEGFSPDPLLSRHWIDVVRGETASICGRRMYEIMRYWDVDQPEWTPAHHDFAAAWRAQPKWVVSRSLPSVGPNTTLISQGIKAELRRLKAELPDEVAICGTVLAQSLTDMGLIDEYRLYFHPVVLGRGKPFFARTRPPLRLVSNQQFGDVTRLAYAAA
jgi:dihydrofolate reductase